MSVYVPRKQRLDMHKAKDWGDVKVLSSNGPNYGLEPDRIKIEVIKNLRDFNNNEDYLLLDGSLVYNCVCAGILTSWHGWFNALVWKKDTYCKRTLNLSGVEERECEMTPDPKLWAVNDAHELKPSYGKLPKDEREVQYIFGQNCKIDPYSSKSVLDYATEKLEDFRFGDQITLCGSNLMNMVCVCYLIKKYGVVTVRLIDWKRKSYVYRDLNLSKDHLDRFIERN